jgi:hypothetical protein
MATATLVPREHPRRIRRAVSLATLFTLILLLVDLNRDAVRCDQDCYGPYRTYEAGHAWTNYPDSWQWDAQNGILGVAFLLAVVAFVYRFTTRLRRSVIIMGASLFLSAVWIAWVELSPPIS